MENEKEFATMTKDEFIAEGKRLFGGNMFLWKFQCPICGNIQTAEDFRQYKDKGATPETVYTQCLGRFQDNPYKAFGENKKGAKESPCDYASFGFFRIGNTVKLDDDKEIVVFPFAEKKIRMTNRIVKPIDKQIACEIVVKNHYLHRKPNCVHSFGLYENNTLLGVIIYGIPASNSVMQLCGKEESKNVIELVRLWTVDNGMKNKESYLVSHSLKMQPYEIVISYADASYGHVGIVYQATNWIYTGLTDRHVAWKIDGNAEQHSRHFFDNYGGIEKAKEILGERMTAYERPQKHRYIYFNTNKRRKRELMKKLKYQIMPYPKTDKVYASPMISNIKSEQLEIEKSQLTLF